MMNIKFDMTALGNLTSDNVYITFAAAASDMCYDPEGTKENIDFSANAIKIRGKKYGTSKAYSLADIASKGLQLNSAISLVGFISYGHAAGIEKLNVGSQPDFLSKSTPRYSIFEISYNGTTGGADITNISQFGGSISLQFECNGTVQSRIGNTLNTTDMFNALTKCSVFVGESTPAIYLDGNGKFIRAVGTNVFPKGDIQTPYPMFNPYLQWLYEKYGSNSVVKKLTNLAPGAQPGEKGSAGFPSTTKAKKVTPGTKSNPVIYNLDYHFDAIVTRVNEPDTLAPAGTYSVQLKGYVNATVANSGTAIHSYKYGELVIDIAADEIVEDFSKSHLYMTNFVYQAALKGKNIVKVSLKGWEDFIQDFGKANAEAAAIEKVAGDFAQGIICGFPGSDTPSDSNPGKTLSELTSYEWWQNPQLAYSRAQGVLPYYSLYGNAVFLNSDVNNAGNKSNYGGVYGSPYDDRFGLNLISPDEETTDMRIILMPDGDLKPIS